MTLTTTISETTALTIVGQQTVVDRDYPPVLTVVLTPGAQLQYVAIIGLAQRQKQVTFWLRDGAQLRVATLVWGRGAVQLGVDYTIVHEGKATSAVTVVKGVLDDAARADIAGLIRIAPSGHVTESFLEQRALVLSDGARANLTPQLEIAAHDVRASHAATVGQLDETQLFYCQSRGLERSAAKALIVQAFVAEILRQLPLAARRDILRHLAISGLTSHAGNSPHQTR